MTLHVILSVCLFVCLLICFRLYHLSVCLCLFVCLSVCLSVCVLVCFCLHPSVCQKYIYHPYRQLPDNPDVEWNEDVIGQYVLASVKKHTINRVSCEYSNCKVTMYCITPNFHGLVMLKYFAEIHFTDQEF